MRQEWKLGDLVTVTTVNRGVPASSDSRARPGKTESWAGEIVGPSLLGPGWWKVRRITAKGTRGLVYAVPHGEIRPRAS